MAPKTAAAERSRRAARSVRAYAHTRSSTHSYAKRGWLNFSSATKERRQFCSRFFLLLRLLLRIRKIAFRAVNSRCSQRSFNIDRAILDEEAPLKIITFYNYTFMKLFVIPQCPASACLDPHRRRTRRKKNVAEDEAAGGRIKK